MTLVLFHIKALEAVSFPAAIVIILIGSIISAFFLQWAARWLLIFDTSFSRCFIVSLIGIIADYGIALLVVSEGYLGAIGGSILSLFVNVAIIAGFLQIGFWRAFLVFISMRILSFLGCLCCCGVTRYFPAL